ncbi:MAG: anaerobic ribonucleoside-triphosphate reductase [candidate division WOR-3 bacterium]
MERRNNSSVAIAEKSIVSPPGIVYPYFRYVRKRNKKIEEFNPEKITKAIFKAAKAVGGRNYKLAERLTKKVIEYLYQKKGYCVPEVEEIQDAVEKILIEEGHAKTAKAYILYREKRRILRKKRALAREATDVALFVQTSEEEIKSWDRQKIVAALVRETELGEELAEKIAREVEDTILLANVKPLTTSLIRELVNAKLIERGLLEVRRRHARLGLPLYDVERIMTERNNENANTPHSPEAINLTLAEAINKQFALEVVFPRDVGEAHSKGEIHLHDLGFINRPYCSGQSIEFVKKFGLSLPGALSIARPAKHPETLLAHMVKFSCALQGHFAGAIGWDAVNIFFAPFLEGMSKRELHQLAQMLIFEYSQQNVARGGQAIFSDLNLYWEVPKHFANTPAIGPGGKYTGKKYKDYAHLAKKFLWAIFDIYMEGDGTKRPFFFPKPLVHITDDFFSEKDSEKFLLHISECASLMGNTYFVFDRGNTAKISECCRLSFKLGPKDLADAQTPWKMRYCALQNVTLNLPRIAYLARHSDEKLFSELSRLLSLAVKAHFAKKKFIEKLLALKENGPLALLAMERDGEPYLRMYRVTYLIGMLGLNEMVQYHLGKELDEDEKAFKFGLKVIAFLNQEAKRYAREYNMHFVLEQTPAESTAYRLARLDLEDFPKEAKKVVKGDLHSGSVYYTNSTYLNISKPIPPLERVYKEGKFHDMIEAGALTHIWLGEARPSKESIAQFVKKTFLDTRNAQIAFSPEFTTCNNCFRTSRGLRERCPYCLSSNVDHATRVTGYFSRVSAWNKGKKQELKDRFRVGDRVL